MINTIRLYRVNTGPSQSQPFEAASLPAACQWVRANSFPNYAYPKWLEIKAPHGWTRLGTGGIAGFRIRFAHLDALVHFGSMAEGMEDVHQNDGEPETASALDRLVVEIGRQIPDQSAFPCAAYLDPDLEDIARAVLSNLEDNLSDLSDDDDADMMRPGDIEITP